MYTVLLHKLRDHDNSVFYKISYTGKSIEDFEKGARWPEGSFELVWSKQFDSEVEAKVFKASYRIEFPKYQSQMIKSKADTFVCVFPPPVEKTYVDSQRLKKAIEKDNETETFLYLIRFADGWYRVGVSNKMMVIPPAHEDNETLVWCRKVTRGRKYAEDVRDFVYAKCSTKRTLKYEGSTRTKKAFLAEDFVEDAVKVGTLYRDSLAKTEVEEF